MTIQKLAFLLIGLFLAGCGPVLPIRQTPTVTPTTTPISATATPSLSPASAIPALLDFDHPRLYEIAGKGPLKIFDITRTDVSGAEHVAIIVSAGELEKQFPAGIFLLFRVDKDGAKLLFESEPYLWISFLDQSQQYITSRYEYWFGPNPFDFVNRAFTDRNHNNLVDIAIVVSNGGNCYDCSEMRWIEIQLDGSAKILNTMSGAKGFVRASNGETAILATHFFEWAYGAEGHTASPFAFWLYGWNGKEYEDISVREIAIYDKRIQLLQDHIKGTYSEPLRATIVAPAIAAMLFDYETTGRLQEGREQVKRVGNVNNWDLSKSDPAEVQKYKDLLLEFEKMVEAGSIFP